MKFGYVFITVSKVRYIHVIPRYQSSKVLTTPVQTIEKNQVKEEVIVDKNTIALLERLSLVKIDPDEGVKILQDSIEFANQILHINTDHVQPLYSVLEKRNLNLRTDKITQGNCQKDILKNAALKEDDYFVAPIGNIPLQEVQVENKEQKLKNIPE